MLFTLGAAGTKMLFAALLLFTTLVILIHYFKSSIFNSCISFSVLCTYILYVTGLHLFTGQSKRLQPSKPCTKGQAAVAVIRGRMAEFIHTEISRLEAESISRQNEMKEVMSELLERGEITQYWVRKMEDEKNRGFEVEIDYLSATIALEQEKFFQENAFLAEMTKQKVALDCQEKLLSCLRDEVNDISEKVNFERGKYIDEQIGVRDMRNDLQAKLEELLDKKSILEAEVEALRILRSWVEDEARKSEARAKLLEEAARRWKWDR